MDQELEQYRKFQESLVQHPKQSKLQGISSVCKRGNNFCSRILETTTVLLMSLTLFTNPQIDLS
jgi:hypothetical protein